MKSSGSPPPMRSPARAYVDAFYSRALRTLGDLDLLESSVLSDSLSRFREAFEQVSSVNAIAASFRRHVLYLIDPKHGRGSCDMIRS